MKDVNKVILVGRLGADPVSRETKAGVAVAHFSVATSRRLKGDASQEGSSPVHQEETQWHRVVVWGKQGETCSQYLKKGAKVYIEGSIRSRKFEAKDGTDKMAFEVHAESVSFLGGGSGRLSVVEPMEPVTALG